MKVAIIGASGKTGMKLVNESLKRGHQVVAVCRTSSADRLKEFVDKTNSMYSLPPRCPTKRCSSRLLPVVMR